MLTCIVLFVVEVVGLDIQNPNSILKYQVKASWLIVLTL